MNTPQWLAREARKIDPWLAEYLDACKATERLKEAMTYSLLAPGKRIRPVLSVLCCQACGGDAIGAKPAAAAIEMVHAFSLIHDDLPAMDDDDLRRGRPTCWVRFGEALAILTGDALLCLAFETLGGIEDSTLGLKLTLELSRAAGASGMTGGQAADILADENTPSREQVEAIYARKTGALIAAACRMGALCAHAKVPALERITDYGRHIGMLFQLVDDLLDRRGEQKHVGKRVGKDADAGKLTLPGIIGEDVARKEARTLAEKARGALHELTGDKKKLEEMVTFLENRCH